MSEELAYTPERARHDPVERIPDAERIVDADGGIADPYRVVGLLAGMERRGKITREMRFAGDEFTRMFAEAHHEGIKAADMSRPYVDGGKKIASSTGPESARRYVRNRLIKLGYDSLAASITWHVLGLQHPIRIWCAIQAQNGRRVDPHKAAEILISALSTLVGRKTT